MSYWPYLAMVGGSLINSFGSDTNQELSQTPGDAFLQNLLGPMMGQGIGAGINGQQLYPTPATPQAQGYQAQGYTSPQAPYLSPSDMIQSGEMQTAQNLREQFYSGGGGGSAMGGVSDQGQVFDSNLAAQMAQGANARYAEMLLPYSQMQNQASQFGASAQNAANQFNAMGQNQMGMMGYNAQQQALAAPWNLAGMYPGSTGNQIVQQQTNPWASALSTGLNMWGMDQLFGGSNF